jgi:two-component system response regulator LytT
MPGLNGFGVIKKLMDRKGKLPQIVFATAFDNYAVQAFEVNAIDYVLKPIEKSRLARAIQRAKKALEAEASPSERLETLVSQIGSAKAPPVKLLVKTQQRLFLVDAEDVIFASIEDGTITVVAREVEGTRTIGRSKSCSRRSNPTSSGARTAPTSSTSTTSRKWCRGSSPATCSKWTISAARKSPSAARRPGTCANC